jgi:hypothetical protein
MGIPFSDDWDDMSTYMICEAMVILLGLNQPFWFFALTLDSVSYKAGVVRYLCFLKINNYYGYLF